MDQRALPYAFGLGTLAALFVIGCSQPAPVAPEPKAKPSPDKSSSRPRAGDYQSAPSKRPQSYGKQPGRPPRQELPPPPPLEGKPDANAPAPQDASGNLQGVILGNNFIPNMAELLVLSGPDTVTNDGVTDKAQKYHFELTQGKDAFERDGSMIIIFTTDMGKPVSNLSLEWKPTKFGDPEHSAQLYPGDAMVGRGVLGVHFYWGDGIEMVNEEIDARINFGPEKAGKIPFVVNVKTDKGWVRGKGTAKIVRR